MSELFTSGSVGRASGNRCPYPEAHQFERFAGIDFLTLTTRPFTLFAMHFPERRPVGCEHETRLLNTAEVNSATTASNDTSELLSLVLDQIWAVKKEEQGFPVFLPLYAYQAFWHAAGIPDIQGVA